MADRQGVEVNYCPTCRGVWLDRGGLDKIIDRSAALPGAARPEQYRESYREHGDRDRHHDEHEHGYEGHRKKSFLSNFFD